MRSAAHSRSGRSSEVPSLAANDAKEARKELLEKWASVMEDLTIQMHEQAIQQGLKPEWFYPKKVVETGDTIRIHWGIRPDVEIAFRKLAEGGSLEEAAKLGADVSAQSLEDLIMNDTVWEQEG